jgi:DNA methyltransferase 1-associated protein 1
MWSTLKKKFIFVRFNKQLELPTFSDAEYHNHLMVDGWTRAETDHLLELCGRFDLRFPIIFDRWNRQVIKFIDFSIHSK